MNKEMIQAQEELNRLYNLRLDSIVLQMNLPIRKLKWWERLYLWVMR
jgi:hypothetical protein